MNRDDIIRMALESGCFDLRESLTDGLERFAALVEQHLIATGYRKCAENQHTTQHCGLLEQAVAAEREACAAICDQRKIITPEWQMDQHYNQAASHCAQAIRLRGRT